MSSDTIIALATPPIKSALALIRVSGEDSVSLARRLFSKPIPIEERKMLHGRVIKDGRPIDDVMLFVYPAKSSMTGENSVEVSCHGSLVIVREIIEAFMSLGARYAKPGEFTERAFLNGKMDLVEAEAVNDLVNASTKEGKNLALLSLGGKSSDVARILKNKLADLLSLIEVNIDFPEYEDIEKANAQTVFEAVQKMRETVSKIIKSGEAGKVIKDGLKVAITGEPNVGKSSLLNALLDSEKAIVSPIPGTTRDLVEGDISIQGIPFHLIDTAGIRTSTDEIEMLGVKKAYASIEEADIVIEVFDATKGVSASNITHSNIGKTIRVYNKKDLICGDFTKNDGVFVSAKNKYIDDLKAELLKRAGVNAESYTSPSLCSARALGLLRRINALLEKGGEDAKMGAPMDLVSISIQEAYHLAQEILGEGVTTDLTDEIFSRFCVGK